MNSHGVLRHNVIVDTKGPGIMVYGARDLVLTIVIERNFVARSRSASAIVLGSGPAIVRNNVVVSGAAPVMSENSTHPFQAAWW